jgi:hypothetical protein
MKTNLRIIELHPELGNAYDDFLSGCKEYQKLLKRKSGADYYSKLSELRSKLIHDISKSESDSALKLRLAHSIVLDMFGLGWTIKTRNKKVFAVSPLNEFSSPKEFKEIVRRSHLVERDAQLQEKSVTEFIKKMEKRRLTATGWHSIFSLMRDGQELAQKLAVLRTVTDDEGKAKVTKTVIDPYLQFVHEGAICPYTGLPLMDIWRYFRHTWINAYKPLPGRSMLILVRDAAVPNHPIIGIAALGSSIVRQMIRDEWIGWDEELLLNSLIETPSARHAKWLLKYLDKLIDEIYVDDLFSERILHSIDLDYPTELVIQKLNTESEKAIKVHRAFPKNAIHKQACNNETGDDIWERQSKTKLFRSKRCQALANLLKIKHTFQLQGFIDGSIKGLKNALKTEQGKQSIRVLLEK